MQVGHAIKRVNRGLSGGLQSILKDEKPVRQCLGDMRATKAARFVIPKVRQHVLEAFHSAPWPKPKLRELGRRGIIRTLCPMSGAKRKFSLIGPHGPWDRLGTGLESAALDRPRPILEM